MSKPDTPSIALWMPLYIERHRSMTSTMSHIEHSAFTYLTMLLWQAGGKLRDDDKWLARNLRLSGRQWQSVREAVLQPFKCGGGFISDTEMIAEIERRKAIVERRSKAGKASAAARESGNTCSTHVEQTDSKCATTRDLTSNLYQEKGYLVEDTGERPFRVVGGDT